MTICYFGIYNSGYSRSRVLVNGFKQNGIKIIECNSRKRGLLKYFDLIKKHWRIRKEYDLMLVGFPGYQAMILARWLSREPIVFDSFSSLYDSMIFDRKIIKPGGLKAKYYWFLDWLSCAWADRIIIDTQAHIDYFSEEFGAPADKFIRVFVGADDRVIRPRAKKEDKDYFLVHFHGSYIPLQGVEYILEAAKILQAENIRFNIIGSKIKEAFRSYNLSNVNFIKNISYEKLPQYMAEADICLGIFGNTGKAQRVIPNKVFEAIAIGQPILTGDSMAIRELLINRENALFCRMADSKDLAEKIMELKENDDLREKIGQNNKKLFWEKLTAQQIVKDLLNNAKFKSLFS